MNKAQVWVVWTPALRSVVTADEFFGSRLSIATTTIQSQAMAAAPVVRLSLDLSAPVVASISETHAHRYAETESESEMNVVMTVTRSALMDAAVIVERLKMATRAPAAAPRLLIPASSAMTVA